LILIFALAILCEGLLTFSQGIFQLFSPLFCKFFAKWVTTNWKFFLIVPSVFHRSTWVCLITDTTTTRLPTQGQIRLPPKDDIQRQQADLQAKILNLLGTNAVVPSAGNQQSPRTAVRGSARGSFGENGRGSRGADSGGRAFGLPGFGFGSGF